MLQKLINIFALVILAFLSAGNAQELIRATEIVEKYSEYQDRLLLKDKFIYGISLGIEADLSSKKNGSFTINLNSSFGKALFRAQAANIIFTYNNEIELFRGGIGASAFNDLRAKLLLETRNSFGFILGVNHVNIDDKKYLKKWHSPGKPLFVSVKNSRFGLLDPFNISISGGTTYINGINHNRNQRLGSLSLSIWRFVAQYYNDGPPFGSMFLGDNFDRYWTGGGQLGYYYRNDRTLFTEFVIRYDNYTGYQANLYKIGNKLQIDNLPYNDKKEQFYNKARIRYILGIRNDYLLNLSIYEPKHWDFQNIIHYNLNPSPFHTRSFDRNITIGLGHLRQF